MKKQYSQLVVLIIFILSIAACQSPQEKLAAKIKSNESILFGDTLRTLNDSLALNTLNLYQSYVSKFPEDSASPEYLFKAADLALGVKKASEAMKSLSQLIEKYPNNNKASSALFMQAFINETVLDNKEKAKEIYSKFMNQYPDHPLYTSAVASYEQLVSGLSDEELIRMFESKQDSLMLSTSKQ
ncbi:MAG TPA: tetratricopeptide repeat protein [Bacteroidia bacterium]|nr:tetratricopeptide repeat protein [Bacteroidia bacterium]